MRTVKMNEERKNTKVPTSFPIQLLVFDPKQQQQQKQQQKQQQTSSTTEFPFSISPSNFFTNRQLVFHSGPFSHPSPSHSHPILFSNKKIFSNKKTKKQRKQQKETTKTKYSAGISIYIPPLTMYKKTFFCYMIFTYKCFFSAFTKNNNFGIFPPDQDIFVGTIHLTQCMKNQYKNSKNLYLWDFGEFARSFPLSFSIFGVIGRTEREMGEARDYENT